jgi:hypothetical protein
VDLSAAENLLKAGLTLPYESEIAMMSAPAENQDVFELAKRYGFSPDSGNQHMLWGPGPTPKRREMIYAQTSMTVG